MFTIKVSLDYVEPTIWRRFAVRSDTTLPDLHDVVQDVMGWEDRHLHTFVASGGQEYEMKSSLDEWDDGSGVLEDGIRVDHLLSAVGDTAHYEYDFGDRWGHQLLLEAIVDGVANPACSAGERACPPEDCGGPRGYEELLTVLADADHPEHEHMAAWAGDFGSERFAVADANDRIAARRETAELAERVRMDLPTLWTLFERAPLEYHRDLIDILRRVDVDMAAVDPVVASVAMEKLTWMLVRVGEDGLKLTAAGYLSPKDVLAIRDELDWDRDWIGTSNREIDNVPVHWLRNAVTQLGLVRVLKGRLVRTRVGASLAEDPTALWTHVAHRLPLGREQYEKDAGALLLTSVAADASAAERNSMMLQSMEMIGWMIPDRERPYMQYLARPTLEVLRLIGAVSSGFGSNEAAAEWGRSFAVHALS